MISVTKRVFKYNQTISKLVLFYLSTSKKMSKGAFNNVGNQLFILLLMSSLAPKA